MKTLRFFIPILIIALASCRPPTEPVVVEAELELTQVGSASSKVLRPSHNELLYAGGKFSTQWNLSFDGEYVNIHLYRGGDFVYTIISKTRNDRIFKWNIPADLPGATYYRLKVENFSDPENFGFSAYFTIEN